MRSGNYLAVAVSIVICGALTTALAEIALAMGSYGSSAWYLGLLMFAVGSIISAAEYLVAIRRRVSTARETRCRRCSHVLRSLQEPRCPECGEAI